MSERQSPHGSSVEKVVTDEWVIAYDANQHVVSIDPRPDKAEFSHHHHHRFLGDPHVFEDNVQIFDFPAPTCSFVLTDGTFFVCDALTPGSPIQDCHIFTRDGKHYSMGQAQAFDENVGWVFVQQEDGSLFSTSSRLLTNHCVWNGKEWSGPRDPVKPRFKES